MEDAVLRLKIGMCSGSAGYIQLQTQTDDDEEDEDRFIL
jgi:hypothetical protein